jgi:hypothetical protein
VSGWWALGTLLRRVVWSALLTPWRWFVLGPNGTGEISTGMNGGGQFGISVAMSGDGGTALIGARGDNRLQGAAWVFTRSGSVWSQQRPKLVGDCTGSCSGPAGTGEGDQGGFGLRTLREPHWVRPVPAPKASHIPTLCGERLVRRLALRLANTESAINFGRRPAQLNGRCFRYASAEVAGNPDRRRAPAAASRSPRARASTRSRLRSTPPGRGAQDSWRWPASGAWAAARVGRVTDARHLEVLARGWRLGLRRPDALPTG